MLLSILVRCITLCFFNVTATPQIYRYGHTLALPDALPISTATAEVKQTLAGTAATKDWVEQAFSTVRGWPVSVVFHQDRLVIGGSRDLPNRLDRKSTRLNSSH